MFLSCAVTKAEPGVASKEVKVSIDSCNEGDSSCSGNLTISLGDEFKKWR